MDTGFGFYLHREGDLSKTLIRFIGISYAVFKMIQIVVDSHRGIITKLSIIHTYNFVFFFPTFISGPIHRYRDFVQSVENPIPVQQGKAAAVALYRMATGIVKTLAISPFLYNISVVALPLDSFAALPWYKLLLAMYAYGLYIYIDFSGYCDMAISTGSFMGIKVPENFINPYRSRNIQEFWMRWHVSLSQWLRDYLYYPGLKQIMKVTKSTNIFWPSAMIFLTFFIMGIWHDLTMPNFYYGLYHGSGLAFFMVFSHYIKNTKLNSWMLTSRLWQIVATALTLHFCFFSFLVFADRFGIFFASLFGINGG